MTKADAAQQNLTGTSKKRGVTRESLLDAGLALFSDRGFDGTSVKDIESAVGLTPGRGSFYRHFSSKEDLIEAVVHREVEKVRNLRDLQQRAVAGSLGDRRAELIMELRLALIGLGEIRSLINLLAREYGRFPELMRQLRELLVDESLDFSSEDFARDIERKLVRGEDPNALSTVVLSAMVGYHLASTFFEQSPGGVSSDRFIETLVDLVMKDK